MEALDTSLAMLRRLPPVALRNALLQQSGIGEGLDIRLRARLQPHVRFDPAAARLHRGALAAAAARELDAEAFTIGPDIFFAAGRFAPHTRDGIGLLAHEVMHVGQQTAAVGDRMRFFTPHGGDAMEREAQNAAASALSADTAETKNRVGGGLHQAAAPPKPAFAFALPLTGGMGGIRPVPAQTATEESGTSEAKSAPDKADARAVADRVYDLLKQEIAAGRLRGGARRKG